MNISKKRPRVLFMIDKTGFGGVQTMAKDLILNTDSFNDVDIYFFYLRDVDSIYGTNKIKSTRVYYSKTHHKYDVASFFEMMKIIKEVRPDILHLNGEKSLIFGVIAKMIWPRLKTIHHEHGPILMNNRFYNKVLKILGSKIDLFIAVSKSTKQALENVSSDFRIKTIQLSNYVSRNFYKNHNLYKSVSISSKKEIVIGFVGRLVIDKGVKYIIEALNQLDSRYRAIVVGDGIELSSLIDYASRLGIRDRIDFLGYLERPDFTKFDVLIVPSLRESFGMVVVESWASGVPVIASNVGGLVEIINHGRTGLLYESKNIHQLINNIISITNNDNLYRNIIDEAYNASLSYSFSDFTVNLNVLYNEITK